MTDERTRDAAAPADTVRRVRPPFAMLPEALLFSTVSDRAVRLYACLDRYANESDKAWPSRETVSRRLGCSVDTVTRAVAELEAAGWLEVERRQDARAVNRYTLLLRPKPSTGSRTGASTGSRTGATSVAAPVQRELEPGTREKKEVIPDFTPRTPEPVNDVVRSRGLESLAGLRRGLREGKTGADPGTPATMTGTGGDAS